MTAAPVRRVIATGGPPREGEAPVEPPRLTLASPADGIRTPGSEGSATGAEAAAAFEQLYQQIAAFSRSMRARIGPSGPDNGGGRAARNVQVARTMFGKWSLEVLSALYGAGSIGFEELRRAIPGITSSVLSYRLKRMESHGLVAREVKTERPVRVIYRLTPKGLTVAVLGEPVFLFLQHCDAQELREARATARRR